MEGSDTGSGARTARVSGSNSHTMPAPKSPLATSAKKTERQPNAVCKTPPASGASTGASAMTAPIRDNSRPARAPE
jgi:hypothetical protein